MKGNELKNYDIVKRKEPTSKSSIVKKDGFEIETKPGKSFILSV